MNALKYLAVDRSLDSDKDIVGRFQMHETGMLPVMGEQQRVKSKSVSAADAETETVSTSQKPGRSMWRRFVGWVGRGEQPDAESQPELPSADTPFSAKNAPVVGRPEKEPVRSGGRLSAIASYNPFSRANKKNVQAEFRFENVRVVCNEMHDTDFIIKT